MHRAQDKIKNRRQRDEGIERHQQTIPKRRQDLLRWNGWGYSDVIIKIDPETGRVHVENDRYNMSNTRISAETREWVIQTLDVDMFQTTDLLESKASPRTFPQPIVQKEFLSSIQAIRLSVSLEGEDRYFRAHGHNLEELVHLREGHIFPRIPDCIIWPNCHDDVVNVVRLATEHNVVLIPFGGGTNVTRALECNPDEKRMIVSLDTSLMNRVLWVDKGNLVACCEAGIIGQDLGHELAKHGLTAGHEPDSYEFSSLGGWVATRASGMKKNQYGNIEDLVVHVRLVTPNGTLEKPNQAPRVSCGPDLNHVVLGSEGKFGIITEVILKVRPLPEVTEYASYVFPCFELGVQFMHQVAKKRCQPASLRLVDNAQYKMGQLLKEERTYWGSIMESLKMVYLTKYKGINLNKMCVCIAVYEGEKVDVESQKSKIHIIAQQFEGIYAGSNNGERGYRLTYVIAYIRDICFDLGILSESFETSMPWDRCASICKNVKAVVKEECKARGIHHFLVSSRVTQVYDSGACVYFYLVFNYKNLQIDALKAFTEIEEAARDEILACGGSLSHHHGVGKVRQKWFSKQVSPLGVEVCKAVKKQLDPKNIFACGNIWQEK